MGSSGLIPRLPRREKNTPLPNNGMTKVFGGPHDFRLTILYPSCFRLNRVESVRVELSPVEPVDRVLDLNHQQQNAMLPIRLSIPGALVSAAETSLEISPFGATQALFHVTAMAAGVLPDARLEVTRDGETEAIPVPMRSQGNAWLAALAGITLLLPLLIFLPSHMPQWSNGGVERSMLTWMPRLPLGSEVASFAQSAFTWLATTGAGWHLSFFALMAMVMIATVLCVSRSPRPMIIKGPKFTLGSPPRPIDPPKYLTPVSEVDIAVSQPS